MSGAPARSAPAVVALNPAPDPVRERLPAVDAARGLALLLMLLDHAAFFAKVNVAAESYTRRPLSLWGPGWVIAGLFTNVSAPTFWFVGGLSVALMAGRERWKHATDDFLLIRAGALYLIDMVLVSWEWNPLHAPHAVVDFELLSCLATALLLMIPLRRLPDRPLIAVTAILFVGYAALIRLVPTATLESFAFPARLLVTFDEVHRPVVTFPVLGWMGLMTMGLLFGRRLVRGDWLTGRPYYLAAGICLAVWLAARLTGLGSVNVWRPAQGVQALFIMQKGPPSLDYQAFNISFGLLALGGFLDLGSAIKDFAPGRWLIAWGQAPLFLFVAHLLVTFVCARALLHLPYLRHADVPRYALTFVVTAAVLLPMARWYRALKERNPDRVIHYL